MNLNLKSYNILKQVNQIRFGLISGTNHLMQVLAIVEAANLPKVGVEAVLVGALPAGAVDPELEQGRVAGMDTPGSITAEQFGYQVLQNPAMGNNPNLFAVVVAV